MGVGWGGVGGGEGGMDMLWKQPPREKEFQFPAVGGEGTNHLLGGGLKGLNTKRDLHARDIEDPIALEKVGDEKTRARVPSNWGAKKLGFGRGGWGGADGTEHETVQRRYGQNGQGERRE